MIYGKTKDGLIVAFHGTADNTIHLHIDQPLNRTGEDEHHELELQEAQDLWRGLGQAIVAAGGGLG